MAKKDISSMKFGMLTAISYSGKNHHGKSIWQCSCECGGSALVLIGSLMSGNSTSCGCKTKIARSAYVAEKKKNGFGAHHERARNSWRHMIDRCTNEKHQDFSSYGDRGISVCPEWRPNLIGGAVAHVSTHLNAAAHHVAHKEAIAKAQFKCPDGVRQSHQKPNGELICVFDLRNGYGLARRRVNGVK